MTDQNPRWRGNLKLPAGTEWHVLTVLLEGFLNRIYEVEVTVKRDRSLLNGRVFSKEVADSIRHLVALHAPTRGLDGELAWASPLYSADTGDMDEEFQWSATVDVRSTSTIDRLPVIRPVMTPEIDKRLDVVVDLTEVPGDDTFGSFSADVPSDWDYIEVEAVLTCTGLQIAEADRRKTIRLDRDGSSRPVLFSGLVTADAKPAGGVTIRLSLSYEGRDSGYAERTIPLASGSGEMPPALEPSLSYAKLETYATGPDLTVRIFALDGSGRYQWSFIASPSLHGFDADRYGDKNLNESPKTYFLKKLATCPTMRAGEHVGKLRGIGEQIWDATPSEFRDVYVEVRERMGSAFSIQIVTDDPYVPWELMFPTDPRIPDPSHLFLCHPVSRWLVNNGARYLDFERGSRVTFVPEYAMSNTLPAAREEGQWLKQTLGAVSGDASYTGFTGFLQRRHPEAVQLIHFAGHGASEEAGGAHGLCLEQGSWMTADEMNGSVRVGRDHRPMFILNACQVGQAQHALGSISGWPSALLRQGFGGLVAPLWSIQDNTASKFMREFLAGFIGNGETLGQAALSARRANAGENASSYAYLVYGDVMATAQP